MSTTTAPPILEADGLAKRYGSVHALQGATLSIRPGEIVALVGDNGAGKSTLVSILSGANKPTSGALRVDGEVVNFFSTLDARAFGIETVYQDLALAPDLPVWANLFLGREVRRKGVLGRLGWLDRKAMEDRAATALMRTHIRIGSVHQLTGRLSGGQRQAVAVGRAAAWGSRVVLMDEPTAALGVEQQAEVANLIKDVAASGTAVLLISHNIPQVHELCDRIFVLFQGRVIADLSPATATVSDIVSAITGIAVVER